MRQIWQGVFVNKISLEHSHAHSFMYCLRLLLYFSISLVVVTDCVICKDKKYLLLALYKTNVWPLLWMNKPPRELFILKKKKFID